MANDLDALKALLTAATPGPWFTYIETPPSKEKAIEWLTDAINSTEDPVPTMHGTGFGNHSDVWKITSHSGCGPSSAANAALIAAAVNTLPSLIAEIERLRAKVQP